MTLGAVALVVIITLSFFSLTGAAQNGIYYSVTRATGHLQVHVEDYRRARAFRDRLMDDAQALVGALHAALPQAEVVPVLSVPVLIESDGRSYGAVLQGLEQPRAVRERYALEYLRDGALPEASDVEGIALGERLARNLQVDLGDTVYLYAPGSEGLGAAAYRVSGTLEVAGSEGFALSSLAAAQELAAPEAINRLELTFPDLVRRGDDRVLLELQERAHRALGEGFSVERWSTAHPDMAGFIVYFQRVALIVSGIFYVLAGLLVANTVYLSVIERVREFGLLNALGTPRRTVLLMVLSESVLLCVGGALVGLTIGALIARRMAEGMRFPAELADFLAEQGLPRVFYGSVTLREVLITLGFTFVTAALAALLPALSAARLEPVEAMRFT